MYRYYRVITTTSPTTHYRSTTAIPNIPLRTQWCFYSTKNKDKVKDKDNASVVDIDHTQNKSRYLHVAPCGDHWVGSSIFAAKHLQPDYVRSIPVPEYYDPEQNERDELTHDEAIIAYDTGKLPDRIILKEEYH